MTGKLIDIRERLRDAADVVIDFATLGVYGIEPEAPRACENGPSGLASGKGGMASRVAVADKVIPVLLDLAAVVVLVQVVLTGDSGARAVWG